ncbi:MAG TPA: hypothetical protein VKL19_18235, partial [Thermoanaerobaculia bacterium]|nr:hypothetical protein [Thermoanaerobaculia bacterium]
MLEVGARQFVHKFAVEIGTADQKQIDADRMHRTVLARVSPLRNQRSAQQRIVQPQTINFGPIDVQQTRAAVECLDHRLLWRPADQDCGVNLSFQESFHRHVSGQEFAAYFGPVDSHALNQPFSKSGVRTDRITQYHAHTPETASRICRRSRQKMNGGGMKQRDAANLIHALGAAWQQAVE